jgi:Glycosyl transferase family 2
MAPTSAKTSLSQQSSSDSCASSAKAAGEIERLNKQVVAQAAELAALRWELMALLKSRPVMRHVVGVKQRLKTRFPKAAHKASWLRRQIANRLAALRKRWTLLHRTGDNTARIRPPVLIIEDGATSPFTPLIPPEQVIEVSPAGGATRSLPVPPEGESPLRKPEAGSLVQWLVEDERNLGRMGTVIADARDGLSLSLLRGRMQAGQMLGLRHLAEADSAYLRDLGKPDFEQFGTSFFTKLPPAFIDPLDRELRPKAEFVKAHSWPKISVVMVSFNQAAYLEEGIRSVLDQDYPNLEFVLVDGNSTDGSVEIAERYRSHFDFLLIEPDKGQSDGLNKGFAKATGDILTWLNSDDLLEPGALFRVAQAFAEYEVDMVAGGCRQIGLTRGQIINNHQNKLPYGIPVALPLGLLLDVDRFWLTACFFYQPEVFFTRDIWQRSGARLRTDLYYLLDYDLWVRMAAAGGTIVHIPEFLACSRTHEQQKTTIGMPYLPEAQCLLKEYAERLIPHVPRASK